MERIKIIKNPQYLSLIFVLLGVLGLCISIFISNPYTTILPISVIVASIGYNLVISIPKKNNRKICFSGMSRYIYIIYFFLISSLVFYWHSAGIERNLIIHGITILLYVVTFFIILTDVKNKYTLATIILTASIHRATIYFSSNNYIGNDVYFHNDLVKAIADIGSLEPISFSRYFYAPLYHIYGAMSQIILELPTRPTVFFVITISLLIIAASSIYSVSNIIFDNQVALLSPFLYLSADFVISRSIQPTVTTLGMALFGLILYTSIKYANSSSAKYIVTFTLLVVAITLTHQLSSIIVIVSIICLTVFAGLYSVKTTKKLLGLTTILALSIVVDLIITRRGVGGISFFDWLLLRFFRHLSRAGTQARPEFVLPNDPAISPLGVASLTLSHAVGTGILLWLAILGSLISITILPKSKVPYAYGLSGIAGVTLTLVLTEPIFGLTILIPFRWFNFIYVPLSILGAFALAYVLQMVQGKSNKYILITVVLLIILPYIMFMGLNFQGSYDDSPFNNAPGAEKYEVTAQEQSLYVHMDQYFQEENEVYIDGRSNAKMDYYDINARTIRMNYYDPQSIIDYGDSGFIMDREYMSTKHAIYQVTIDGSNQRVHGPIPVNKINNMALSKTYSNGNDSLRLVNRGVYSNNES